MKTKKIFDSLLAAILISLSLALTACDDDDDKDGGSSSSSLTYSTWYGEDNSGNLYTIDFYEDDIDFYNISANGGCSADYSVSGGKIKFSNIDSWGNNNLKSGSFSYKVTGRKGDRDLIIYDALRGGDDLYLEEVDYRGSDDDWDYDW